MSSQADVGEIAVLADLRGRLIQFGTEAQQVLQAASQEIHQTRENLMMQRVRCTEALHRAEEAYAQAQAALQECVRAAAAAAAAGEDGYVDCSGVEQAALEARVAVQRAVAELEEVGTWQSLVERAEADYQAQARYLTTYVGEDLPRAVGLLDREIAALWAYKYVAHPGSPAPPATSTPDPPTPVVQPAVGPVDVPGLYTEVERTGEKDVARESVAGSDRSPEGPGGGLEGGRSRE